MRMHKAKKAPHSVRSKNSLRATYARLVKFASDRRLVIVTAGCVIAVVAIAAAGIASRTVDETTAVAQPDAHTAANSAAPLERRQAAATPRNEARKAVVQATADTDAAGDRDAAPVTLTGCLQSDDETFWLKDASGDGAPTSRSWKSGFLKKRAARVELVDSARSLQLPAYVGQRVAATGTLVNREMHTRSLRRVGSSCS